MGLPYQRCSVCLLVTKKRKGIGVEMTKCPICSSPLSNDYYQKDTFWISCLRCGNCFITRSVRNMLEGGAFNLSETQIVNISGWIRENQGTDIDLTKEKLYSLKTLKTLTVSEKADKILIYFSKLFPVAGASLILGFNKVGEILNTINHQSFPENKDDPFMKMFNYNAHILLPIISLGRIINTDEFIYIIEVYLRKEKGYLSNSPQKITPAGWTYLESLRQANPESKKAFVAMWFDPEMEKVYDNFINKAIENSGFEPIQIGRKEHNNDINDEIIGEIRNCKFVVADFTGNRRGVYYEAGFAYGQNIEVIHSCHEDQLKDVHFDINHRNIIKWSDGEDLYNKLLKRIKATIA